MVQSRKSQTAGGKSTTKSTPKKTTASKPVKTRTRQDTPPKEISKDQTQSESILEKDFVESENQAENSRALVVPGLVPEVVSKSNIPDPKIVRPIIQVVNLVKKYGDFVAVDNVTFDVKKGEIFGILGPNGAGKTTTLEIIETLLPKTSGKVLVDGLDIDSYRDHVKNMIGIQLQSGGFYPKLNLVEILELFASLYDVTVNAKSILESVSLGDKAKNMVDQLSGGQKQRFSIATTLIADPLIIFLDEPTTGLDPQARRNLWDMILDLKAKGKTIVMTTHYMDEAEELCDRVAIMDSGKILETNTAEGFIKGLLKKGFKKPKPKFEATLEDVFLNMTGKKLRD